MQWMKNSLCYFERIRYKNLKLIRMQSKNKNVWFLWYKKFNQDFVFKYGLSFVLLILVLKFPLFQHAADDDITAMPHHPNEAHRPPSGHSHQQQQQGSSSELSSTAHLDKWDAPMKSEVPERNYSDEFAVSFAIPGMIFALLLSVLTVILCFQHEKL